MHVRVSLSSFPRQAEDVAAPITSPCWPPISSKPIDLVLWGQHLQTRSVMGHGHSCPSVSHIFLNAAAADIVDHLVVLHGTSGAS